MCLSRSFRCNYTWPKTQLHMPICEVDQTEVQEVAGMPIYSPQPNLLIYDGDFISEYTTVQNCTILTIVYSFD